MPKVTRAGARNSPVDRERKYPLGGKKRTESQRAGENPAPTHYADLSAAGCPFVELSMIVQSPVSTSSIR